MKRALSFLLLLLGLVAVLCILTAWFVYREHRQERLNHDLIAAVKRNDTKAVVSLLDQDADANCRDEPYRPVPWWQRLKDRLRRVKPKPSTAPTPLVLALRDRPGNVFPPENLPLVQALLDHKANVNARDEYAFTPLNYAMWCRKKATTHLLLKYGADIKPDYRPDYAPLVWATGYFFDSTDVLADMLHRGADVNQQSRTGITALSIAVRTQNVEAVRLLLSYHADITIRGNDGLTPLAEAKRSSTLPAGRQIIDLLKQAGAKE